MNNFDRTLHILREGKEPEVIKVVIEKDRSTGEYRVPAPDGREEGASYTDDKQDAIDTAKAMYKGKEIKIAFRTVAEFVGKKYQTEKEKAKDAKAKKKPAKKKK